VVLQGQFLSKTRCGRGGAPKRKFSAQTWQSRAYTPPPSSVGLNSWWIEQLSTWSFQAYAVLHSQFLPKTRCEQGVLQNGNLVLKRYRVGPILSPWAPLALISSASCSSQPKFSGDKRIHVQIPPKTMCGLEGVLKKCDHDVTLTWPSRAYTPPPSSVGLDSWCIEQLQSGLSEHTLCVIQIHRQKKKLCTLWWFEGSLAPG